MEGLTGREVDKLTFFLFGSAESEIQHLANKFFRYLAARGAGHGRLPTPSINLLAAIHGLREPELKVCESPWTAGPTSSTVGVSVAGNLDVWPHCLLAMNKHQDVQWLAPHLFSMIAKILTLCSLLRKPWQSAASCDLYV